MKTGQSKSAENSSEKNNSQGYLVQKKMNDAQNSSSEGLDNETRPGLEQFLGFNFGNIRVHNNAASHQASDLIHAKAYTTGNHIFLGNEVNSMSPIQRKSLLAHETVHTVQQKSFSAAGIQAKSNIDSPQSSYEQVADRIANAFTQSQKEGYHSTALQMRPNLHINPITKPTVQRLPKTWGGEWFADAYTISNVGDRHLVKMDLRFKPGVVADAELIGLTQIARSYKNKKAYYINNNATTKKHSIQSTDAIEIDSATKETDEGAHIDQADYNRNPLYAAEGAPATDVNLYDTGADAFYGKHGSRFKDATGKLVESDAELHDNTGLNDSSKDSGQIFETTALAIKGNQAGTYYGSVKWGWRTNDKGDFSKIDPIEVVSQGVPSSSFMKSAEIWNASKTSTPSDTLNLPIVDVKVTTSQISEVVIPPQMSTPGPQMSIAPRSIPAGTRVQIIFLGASTATGVKLPQIKVVDGPFTGTILTISDADLATLHDERP